MKRHKKWIITGLLLLLVCGGICVLWMQEQKAAGQKLSLIYIPKTEDGTNDFWTSLILGTRLAAAEYEADLEVLAPDSERDADQQKEYLKKAVEMKPDAILISPSRMEGYEDIFQKAKKEGIPIVYIDSYTTDQMQKLTVATDNLKAGRLLGEYAAGVLGEDDKIAIISYIKGASSAVEREQGFREGLGELEDNIVEVIYCDSFFEKSEELAKDLMEKYPDLKIIAGMNEYSSVGAARAVKKANAQDRVHIIGVDSSQEAVQMMEQGIFQAIVVQKAFKMGYMGVKETIRMLNGETVEKNQDSGCELVTPDNMYNREIEKLLFPFYTMKN